MKIFKILLCLTHTVVSHDSTDVCLDAKTVFISDHHFIPKCTCVPLRLTELISGTQCCLKL